jgi:hypothetical protein
MYTYDDVLVEAMRSGAWWGWRQWVLWDRNNVFAIKWKFFPYEVNNVRQAK